MKELVKEGEETTEVFVEVSYSTFLHSPRMSRSVDYISPQTEDTIHYSCKRTDIVAAFRVRQV